MAAGPHRLDDATSPAATLPKMPDRFTDDVFKERPELGVYINKMTEAQGIRIEAKLDRVIELLERAEVRR